MPSAPATGQQFLSGPSAGRAALDCGRLTIPSSGLEQAVGILGQVLESSSGYVGIRLRQYPGLWMC